MERYEIMTKSRYVKILFDTDDEDDNEVEGDWEVYNTKRVTTRDHSSIDISMDELSIYIRFITHHKDILLKLYATKLSETIELLNRSDDSYTDQFTFITPTN